MDGWIGINSLSVSILQYSRQTTISTMKTLSRSLLSLLLLCWWPLCCSSFQSSNRRSFITPQRQVQLHLTPMMDPSMHEWHSILQSPLWSSVHLTLADAATATADVLSTPDVNALTQVVDNDAAATAAAATADEGWWKQYLNLFKTGLIFIHDHIDGPLRERGITQTWGISIALFTACK